MHRHTAIDANLVVVTDLKWPVSKLVFIVANEPEGDIALCLLARLLPADVGFHSQPALDVLRGLADAREGLPVAAAAVRAGAVLVDPVGPETARP